MKLSENTSNECLGSEEIGDCATSPSSEFALVASVQRVTESPTCLQASELLNQQIWCWGRDIDSSAGNLLIQYGFQRIEKPAESKAASLYRLDLSSTMRVVVRGFGLFFGDDRYGGLFLRRYQFQPMLTPSSDLQQPAWMPDDLPRLSLPRADEISRCQSLLVDVIDWISRYESWISEHLGVAYRSETLTTWPAKQKHFVPAEEMPRAWRNLGLTAVDHPERFISCADKPISRPA
ncbi:MAG: hypothetical protein O2931_13045 [Planctomycetota bacterium]|nr:hypothetical protein [Planctomycetota bacterium]MDA1179710.1 hypothetical protein [Planctomycetota bacterium]